MSSMLRIYLVTRLELYLVIYTLSFQEEAAVHVPPIVYVERYVQDLRRQYASLEETRDDVVEEIDHKARGLTVQRSRVRHYTNLLQTYSEDALTALKKVDVLTGRYEKERARIIALERLRTAINAPTCTPLRRTRSEADAILPPAPKRARFD
ncbi:hypothetical protein EUX98_g2210 [Antrodiella citrinella]|uniref:Uncharacterized protein n=1 Tax=Antrodiella citrinella TaxID=2447956 RepID=A0A4S4N142_9APHY|nr:hypothetical protein EUX98_g2210 [Antrodiella citrinella]